MAVEFDIMKAIHNFLICDCKINLHCKINPH
jgi:hypothetical protein